MQQKLNKLLAKLIEAKPDGINEKGKYIFVGKSKVYVISGSIVLSMFIYFIFFVTNRTYINNSLLVWLGNINNK